MAAAYLCAALRPAAAARSPLRASSRKVAPACRLRRGYASEAHADTRITRLDNGVTVATEANPASPLATVGAWFAAGSRAEALDTPGTAYLLERVALKGSKTRSETALSSEVDRIGARLRSYTSRENNAFYADVLKDDVGKMVGIIADSVTNPAFSKANFEAARAGAIAARAEADNCPESMAFDHLYATAFQGTDGRLSRRTWAGCARPDVLSSCATVSPQTACAPDRGLTKTLRPKIAYRKHVWPTCHCDGEPSMQPQPAG
ncbi:MAG: peptidase family M16-domain-containing protein, partial [Olpidium bornovanus]